MKKVTEIYECDICKKQEVKMNSINYPVLFLTEQTEGRSVDPYICQQKIDVCKDCETKIIKLTGMGAMGHNEYKIK